MYLIFLHHNTYKKKDKVNVIWISCIISVSRLQLVYQVYTEKLFIKHTRDLTCTLIHDRNVHNTISTDELIEKCANCGTSFIF